jgi:hypothetical protein
MREINHREVIDEQFLERTFGTIKREDYPNAPKTLFENPKAFLWDNKFVQPDATFLAHHGGWFRCTVIVRISGTDPVQAVGEAQSKVR